jgi:hypothetical protein
MEFRVSLPFEGFDWSVIGLYDKMKKNVMMMMMMVVVVVVVVVMTIPSRVVPSSGNVLDFY